MEIYNIGNNTINIYLLNSGTHLLLIDTGYPNQLNDIGRKIRNTGFKIRDIDFLIVTHFHIDHAGAVEELKNEGVKFALLDIQQDFIKPIEDMMAGKFKYTPLLLNNNKLLTINNSIAFLKQLNINGKIIATPAHTNDSISLLLDTGEAFTGDLIASHLVTDNDSIAKKSWQKLISLGATKIYPSHGKIYEL